jgi:hypothetical protein
MYRAIAIVLQTGNIQFALLFRTYALFYGKRRRVAACRRPTAENAEDTEK